MDAAADLGRNPVSTRFSLSMEMNRLNRSRETKFSGANPYREILIFPVRLTPSRIGNLTELIYTLGICMTILYYTILYYCNTLVFLFFR